MEPFQDIIEIRQQIAEKDSKLAMLFDDFVLRIIQERELKIRANPMKPVTSKKVRLNANNILDKESEDGKMNVIPSDFSRVCQSHCLCFALDKWQSSRGFKGVANEVFDYWSHCYKINQGTLIFSYAWDDFDFIEKYKKRFDQYVIDPQHTVVVILVSSMDISIQYFNK